MNRSFASFDAETAMANDDALEARAAALVNPESGLANDYLNVFNELVMLVEQLPMMPELIDDIIAWRPISYEDYFRKSNLPGRAVALDNYQKLAPDLRQAFEEVVAELDRCATGNVAAIRIAYRRARERDPAAFEDLCSRAASALHALLARATHIVNYGAAREAENAQMRADRLLAVRIQALKDIKDFQDRPRFSQD